MGLIDYVQQPGEVQTRLVRDVHTGGVIEESYQDCEPTLKENKALQNEDTDHYFSDRSMVRAAQIPMGIIHKWLIEDGINFFDPADREKVHQKLDDPEYDYLRVWKGKLSRKPFRTFYKASTG